MRLIKVIVLLTVCLSAYADHKGSAYTGPYYNDSYVGKIYGGSPIPPTRETVPNYSVPRDKAVYSGSSYVGKVYGGSPKPYTQEMKRDEE